jgi:S1-C subfamily serine protease
MRTLFLFVAGLTLVKSARAEDLATLQEKARQSAVARVAPYVCTIETSGGTDVIVAGPRGQKIRRGTGPTTGVLVGADGYIITSAFNFANKPNSIIVAVPGQKDKLVAKVVSTDKTRFLTLLKVEATGLPVPKPLAKKDLKVGMTALAVGRTLSSNVEEPPSMSEGIVSAVGRIWGKAVQTDAKVSPTNYGGPLIDLGGNIIGILVPASPRADTETAGYEWYDSGIGFAMPLEDVLRVLPRMKKEKVLNRGILGVTMKSKDIYADDPVIATVSPGTAAEAAGLKVGDKMLKIDGKVVNNYAQVQHQLGGLYEGDVVSLDVERDKKTVTIKAIKLGGLVASFNQPFLGILPMRDDPDAGVAVRYVFPKSPAATAGIKEGDRITKAGANPARMQVVKDHNQLSALLAAGRPGAKLNLEVTPKGGKKKNVAVTLGDYIDAIPAELPAKASFEKAGGAKKADAPKKDGKKDDKKEDQKPRVKTGLYSQKNAARDRTFWVFVPEDYDANISYAMVIWLHPVGKSKEKDIEAIKFAWEDFCSDNHIILLMPTSENETGWVAGEEGFIAEAARTVMNGYRVDKRRVITHGMGVGGQMAFYLGFGARDLVRGVATIGAVLTSSPKERVPTQPLAFFVVGGEKDPILPSIKDSTAKLGEYRYPTVYRELKEKGHQYFDFDTEKVLKELVRWVDSLDRL